jgi:hypothetical protein
MDGNTGFVLVVSFVTSIFWLPILLNGIESIIRRGKMNKCDTCLNLFKRIDGRKILCHKRGKCNQRIDTCNQYVFRKNKAFDMLSWVEV